MVCVNRLDVCWLLHSKCSNAGTSGPMPCYSQKTSIKFYNILFMPNLRYSISVVTNFGIEWSSLQCRVIDKYVLCVWFLKIKINYEKTIQEDITLLFETLWTEANYIHSLNMTSAILLFIYNSCYSPKCMYLHWTMILTFTLSSLIQQMTKQDLKFQWRQFAWNAKTVFFSGKNKNKRPMGYDSLTW